MNPNGINFTFRASPKSSLNVYFKEKVTTIDTLQDMNQLELVCDVQIETQDTRIRSLLSLLIENIINSLTKDLADIKESLISKQSSFEYIPVESIDESSTVTITSDHPHENNHNNHNGTVTVIDTWKLESLTSNIDIITWSKKFASGVGTSVNHHDDGKGLDIAFITMKGYKLEIRFNNENNNVMATLLTFPHEIDNKGKVNQNQTQDIIKRASKGIINDLNLTINNHNKEYNNNPYSTSTFIKHSVPDQQSSVQSNINNDPTDTATNIDNISDDFNDETDSIIDNNIQKKLINIKPISINQISNSTSTSTSSTPIQQSSSSLTKLSSQTSYNILSDDSLKSQDTISKKPISTISTPTSGRNEKSVFSIDPQLQKQAKTLGVRLEKFMNNPLSENAVSDFNNLLRETQRQGIYNYFDTIAQNPITISTSTDDTTTSSTKNNINNINNNNDNIYSTNTNNPTTSTSSTTTNNDSKLVENKNISLQELFQLGITNHELSAPIIVPSIPSFTTSTTSVDTAITNTTSTANTTIMNRNYHEDEKKLLFLMNELKRALPERHDDILGRIIRLLLL